MKVIGVGAGASVLGPLGFLAEKKEKKWLIWVPRRSSLTLITKALNINKQQSCFSAQSDNLTANEERMAGECVGPGTGKSTEKKKS